MYNDFYPFHVEPFGTHPDPGIVFTSNTHKAAWDYLISSMEGREPYLLLTGEYGMGKTLLCLRLIRVLKEMGGKPPVEYVSTPNETYESILRRMAVSLGADAVSGEISGVQTRIYDHFRTLSDKDRLYLMIDDAQELDPSNLVRLKQLSTFNHNGFFPIHIIFVAHPCFLETLKTPEMSALNQRIKRRCHLSRFSLEDTKNYIDFRLVKSGGSGIPVFDDPSLQKIHEVSGGVPRLINNICDTCLLIGAAEKRAAISLPVVERALLQIEGCLPETGGEKPPDFKEENVPAAVSDAAAHGTSDAESSDFQMDAEEAAKSGRIESRPESKEADSGKLKRAALLALGAVLLLMTGSGITWLVLTGGRPHPVTAPVPPSEIARKIPLQVPPVPQPESRPQVSEDNGKAEPGAPGSEKVPLRKESAFQLPDELLSPAGRLQGATEAAAPAAPVQPETGEPPPEPAESAFFPFSLKSSSYQQPSRAEEEIDDIRQLGLTAYLVRVKLGEMGIWWRVYIGFFATEADAQHIKAAYHLSRVTVEKTDYACALGEFSTETGMKDMFDRLKQAGYFPYVIQRGKSRFGVYVGAYERARDAEFEHRTLLKNGFKNQIVKR